MEVFRISQFKHKLTFSENPLTVVNLLTKQLLKKESVRYAGYDTIHPLESRIHLTIEIRDRNPKDVFNECIDEIVKKISILRDKVPRS